MNPYLQRLREKYEGLRTSIEGLQTRAAEEGRDLTEEELRSIKEMGEQAKTLHTQIQDLTEIENRNASVAKMNATLAEATAGPAGAAKTGPEDGKGAQTRSATVTGRSGDRFYTQDRDPGHYRRDGQHSFFRDLVLSRSHDHDALQRLTEHHRALATGDAGAGLVPPRWLTEEYAELARQGRALANAVRNIPLGDDPRPLTLPKQTAGADEANPAEQESENDPVPTTDKFDSDVDTVTPKPTAGSQKVSRQMIDMSNPAIDELIYGDLIAEYNLQVEKKVGTAIMAVGTPLQAIEGPEVPVTNPAHFAKQAIRAAVAVRQARKMRATFWAMSVGRHGEFLNLTDTTGRPLIPDGSDGPMNAFGVGSILVDGRYRGLGLIATEGVAVDDEFAAVKASDVLLFESNMLRFRYEQPEGPETIKLGVWAYTAVLIRYGTAPIKRVAVSEESPS